MALVYCQFQSFFANGLEDFSSFPGEIRGNLSCNPNMVHVLSAFVSLDDCTQILAHTAWKYRHRSARSFSQSFIGQKSAGEFECSPFYWPVVHHLQTVMCLGAIEGLSFQVLCCVSQSAYCVNIVGIIICNKVVDFNQI